MIFEAEFAPGLLSVARDEIRTVTGNKGRIIKSYRDDALQFTFEGEIQHLLRLRTVIAIYAVVQFDVPRPKALLGHQHLHRLLDTIRSLLSLDKYQSLYVSAAGSYSSVMMRIKSELCQHLGLVIGEDEGDLLLRMRRTPGAKQGWDVLIRLTPRPLATRDWRICNYEGALNASVAAAMIHLTNPTPEDRFLNIACGSGTMLIERHQIMSAKVIIGCDNALEILACAKENIKAAQIRGIDLNHADAIQSPLASNSIDKLVADLPFGHLVGSHEENEWLYPAIMTEAARVARKNARFVLITHEIRLMEQLLSDYDDWNLVEKAIKITLSGLHPRIYILERK